MVIELMKQFYINLVEVFLKIEIFFKNFLENSKYFIIDEFNGIIQTKTNSKLPSSAQLIVNVREKYFKYFLNKKINPLDQHPRDKFFSVDQPGVDQTG